MEVMNEMTDALLAGLAQCRSKGFRYGLSLFCLPLIAAWIGCGSDLPRLYRVAGTVTLDGEPLKAGHVSLFPDGAGSSVSLEVPSGIIKDGNYEILSGKRSGATAGPYKVVVTATNYSGDNAPPMGGTAVPVRSLIDAAFSSRSQTPLAFEVVAQPEAGAYDLQVTNESGRKKR